MTAVDRKPVGERPPRAQRKRVVAVRTSLTAWLGRPLADFHLLLAIFGVLTVDTIEQAIERAGLVVVARPSVAPLFSMVPGVDRIVTLDLPDRAARRAPGDPALEENTP